MSAKRGRPPSARPSKIKPAVIGERVRELRESKGWNQPELAYRARIYPTDISHIECNRREIRVASFLRLVIALETSADYLLGLTGHAGKAR